MPVQREAFGQLPSGEPVERVTLHGVGGFAVRILSFGATVQALLVPGPGGVADVVAGHDTLDGYLAGRNFFGATIGRYANRIAGGRFTLDGKTVQLPSNDGANTLHGGPRGFDQRLWEIAELSADPVPRLVLRRLSSDGEEGFPGTLDTSATFTLSGPTELSVLLEARTTASTVVNLTNHSFFHLGGGGSDVLRHRLQIAAAHYLPVDASLIPLDNAAPVAGTPFDFRQPRAVGERLRDPDGQLLRAHGYDHNFCLDHPGGALQQAAWLEDPDSGRSMVLLTDKPGLQFYSGNFLDASVAGKNGRPLRQSDALCLEPQDWPDAPNRPRYPTVRLDPGGMYRHTIVYRFAGLTTG